MFLLLVYFFFYGVLLFLGFNLGAYNFHRLFFWNHYFPTESYLVSEGEKSTSITNLDLPEDVLLEILARLPVKSLLRFRSVSKSWRDIMKEPTFITKHHLSQVALNNGKCVFARFTFIASNDFVLLEKDEEGGIKCTTLELPPFLKNSTTTCLEMDVAGPCNGIVVISDWYNKLFLWNPVTREYKALPPSSLPSSVLDNMTNWYTFVGFGIDPRTKDYKIVRVWHFHLLDNPDCIGKVVEVMSLSATNLCRPKSETWKIIPSVPSTFIDEFTFIDEYPLDHIYANGKYCWYWENYNDVECRIVWFDMGTEVFGEIELLPNPCCLSYFKKLVVLKGFVMLIRRAYIVEVEEENNNMYELLIIDDDGRLTKYVTFGPFMTSEKPMGFWRNLELIMLAKSSGPSRCSDLIFYDINTNVIKSKTEGGLIGVKNLIYLFDLYDIYNESLISFGG